MTPRTEALTYLHLSQAWPWHNNLLENAGGICSPHPQPQHRGLLAGEGEWAGFVKARIWPGRDHTVFQNDWFLQGAAGSWKRTVTIEGTEVSNTSNCQRGLALWAPGVLPCWVYFGSLFWIYSPASLGGYFKMLANPQGLQVAFVSILTQMRS